MKIAIFCAGIKVDMRMGTNVWEAVASSIFRVVQNE
jgi:hypothetical protein